MAKPAPEGSNTIRLPTFVIGPRSKGRGYQVLPPSTDFPGSTDLAMILLEWSRTGEAELFGRVALPDSGGQAVLFRATRLEQRADQGERAFMHGVLLTEADIVALDHRPETLLDALGQPDGTADFAHGPKAFAQPAPIAPSDDREGRTLGLAWHDRLIVVDKAEAAREALEAALATIAPVEQRARITGWVTSGKLVSRGRLSPLRDSQLVVAIAPFDEDSRGHLRCEIGEDLRVEYSDPPESWQAFEALQALLSNEESTAIAGEFAWRMDRAGQSGQAIVEEGLHAASGVLPSDRMIRLLSGMISGPNPVLAEAARNVLGDYSAALSKTGISDPLLDAIASNPSDLGTVFHNVDRGVFASMTRETASNLVAPALAKTQSGALAGDPRLRAGIVAFLRAAVRVFEKGAPEYASLVALVRSWPENADRELLPLAHADSLRMILAKSEALGVALTATLRPENYLIEAGENVPVLQLALDASAMLRDERQW